MLPSWIASISSMRRLNRRAMGETSLRWATMKRPLAALPWTTSSCSSSVLGEVGGEEGLGVGGGQELLAGVRVVLRVDRGAGRSVLNQGGEIQCPVRVAEIEGATQVLPKRCRVPKPVRRRAQAEDRPSTC